MKNTPSKRLGVAALISVCATSVLLAPTGASASSHPETASCSRTSTRGWTSHSSYANVATFNASTSSKSSGALLSRDTVVTTLASIAGNTFTAIPAGTPVRFEINGTAGGGIQDNKFHKKVALRRADFIKTMLKQATDPIRGSGVSFYETYAISAEKTISITVYTCGSATKVSRCKTENPAGLISILSKDLGFTSATRDKPRSEGAKPADQAAWDAAVSETARLIALETTTRWGRSVTVRVTGFASPEGSDSSNTWLAKERAKRLEKDLKKALRAHKLKSGQVNFITKGSATRLGAFARVEVFHCGG